MHTTTQAINDAFNAHARMFKGRGWSVPDHVDCWIWANAAFERDSYGDFKELYKWLKSYWRIFRGAHIPRKSWGVTRAFNRLRQLPDQWRTQRLSQLSNKQLPDCWELVIREIKNIKSMSHGPSVVAISKFLHFWNPRLFVIVDNTIMWEGVFARNKSLLTVRERIQACLPKLKCRRESSRCDLLSYLAILSWCADEIRNLPQLMPCFKKHVIKKMKEDGLSAPKLPLHIYEGVAMEWYLSGLHRTRKRKLPRRTRSTPP